MRFADGKAPMAQIRGEEKLDLPRDEVWRRLNDPDVLAESIPGCRGFERKGDEENLYRTAIAIAAGAVKGVYEGTVAYSDVVEPDHCTIEVEGKGDKGTISGNGEINLKELDRASTEVAYTGTFKLTGPVAGVGARLAPGISRKMIVETLHNLEQDGAPDVVSPAEEPGSPVERPAGEDAFRPFSISAGYAFLGGLVVGAVVGLVIGLVI